MYDACKFLIDGGVWEVALIECNLITATILEEAGGINVYDIRKKCTYPPLCYNMKPITDFMNVYLIFCFLIFRAPTSRNILACLPSTVGKPVALLSMLVY